MKRRHNCQKQRLHFEKMWKTEDLKSPVKDAKKMKIASCAGSPKVVEFLITICGYMQGSNKRSLTDVLENVCRRCIVKLQMRKLINFFAFV